MGVILVIIGLAMYLTGRAADGVKLMTVGAIGYIGAEFGVDLVGRVVDGVQAIVKATKEPSAENIIEATEKVDVALDAVGLDE